jgi:hypothetical protein
VPISARNASTIEIDAVNREVRAPVRNWVPANVNAGPVGVAFLIIFEARRGHRLRSHRSSHVVHHQAPMRATEIINALGDAGVIVFASFFVLSIVLPIIQGLRGKEIWETRAFGFLVALYYLWLIPLVLLVFVIPILWITRWLFRWPNF